MALEYPHSFSDQNYLLTGQYNNADKLNARISLHQRFSTNPYDWHRWIFDQFQIPPHARILEVGSGSGILWQKNQDRIFEDWTIILSDLSEGMLQEAQRNFQNIHGHMSFNLFDVQAIPFEDDSFDIVIANHMLYHVPDRAKALSEIRRVLKPGGHFYAATNGIDHMQGLRELVNKFDPDNNFLWKQSSLLSFRLENGAEELSQEFATVELHLYESNLVVTEAQPLVAFVLSTSIGEDIIGNRVAEFARFVEQEIAEHGAIYITKSTGLFEAF